MQVELVSGAWIPDSLTYIRGSKAQDSGFYEQNFPDSEVIPGARFPKVPQIKYSNQT